MRDDCDFFTQKIPSEVDGDRTADRSVLCCVGNKVIQVILHYKLVLQSLRFAECLAVVRSEGLKKRPVHCEIHRGLSDSVPAPHPASQAQNPTTLDQINS